MRGPRRERCERHFAQALFIASLIGCVFCSGCHRHASDCAQVRLIDAVPDADRIEVSVLGKRDRQSLVFRQEIPYADISAGTYRPECFVERRGSPARMISMQPVTLIARRQYTALASGLADGTPAAAIRFFDEPPPEYPLSRQQSLIRVVNASADAGRIDILLNNLVAFKNLPFDQMSYATAIPAARYDCIAKTAGDRFTPLNTPKSFDLRGGKSYLIVVAGRVRDNRISIELYTD